MAANENDTTAIGFVTKLKELSFAVPFREVIFCEGTLSFAGTINALEQLPGNISVKFHAAGSKSIVGSDSKDSSGEAVSMENGFNLNNPYNRRLKRLIDVAVSLLLLLTFPIHFLFVKKPVKFILNCMAVLFAQKTWIGYSTTEINLPKLRQAIIACNGVPLSTKQLLPKDSLQMVDYWYARDYEPANDLRVIWRMYRKLGG